MTLTAAGRNLAARMGPALEDVRAALFSSDDPASPVRLRASRSLVGLWLARRLQRLPKGVALDLRSDLTLEASLAGGADLGIFFDPRPAWNVTSERLLPVEITAVSAPRLADGRTAPSDAGDLLSFTLIDLAGQSWFWPRASSVARATLIFDGNPPLCTKQPRRAWASRLAFCPLVRSLSREPPPCRTAKL